MSVIEIIKKKWKIFLLKSRKRQKNWKISINTLKKIQEKMIKWVKETAQDLKIETEAIKNKNKNKTEDKGILEM